MASANSTQRPPSPANNSFPITLHASDSQRTPSVISSRMTDIASEDGDEYYPEGAAAVSRSVRGLPGRSINDLPRPPSAMSSQTRPSTRSPPSRRGVPFTGGWRSGAAFGGPGGTISNSSRPPSATSRTSRTHVPSLASHAFFRPMSSQRLQAQRGGRPTRTGQSMGSLDGYSDKGSSNVRRQSTGSNATAPGGAFIQHDGNMLSPSRGTDTSGTGDMQTINASPTDNATVQSMEDSERPLQDHSSNVRTTYLGHSSSHRQNAGGQLPKPKSPKSFRANFLMSTKESVPVLNDLQGQRDSSPSRTQSKPMQSKATQAMPPQAGLNYEYFSGNTAFCWGGRVQNTRDRPINIATGILVILPSALFLGYS